ncbi:hypothetical protein [uncultured Cetobacterium sp.]|uniref:hypothetical protein n=1 Tax=uncultured Cetobacterium sp. TaxID=527638 RepID=UPI0025F4B5D1|nr:hypothetical protein [uncultured Cetobacterium sp.]
MKKNFFKSILLIGLSLILIMILNFKVDPMRFYRNPIGYIVGNWRDDERILNAGIIRNSDFDSILIGSSMTRNFDIESIDNVFNWKTIKLTMSAATQRDIYYTYNFVKEVNPNFKNVILGIDIETFFQNEDFQKIEFDKSFYVKDRISNPGYLLNFRTLKYSLEFLKLNLFKTREEIENIYKLGYKYEYKKENVLSLVKEISNLSSFENIQKTELDFRVLENMKNNYSKNLKIILENNRDKNFYLFFPPYSIYYYDKLLKDQKVNEYNSFKKFLKQEMKGYSNVQLYDFQEIDSIVNNLDNYGDLMHFSPEVSQQLLEYMFKNEYKVNSY